MDKKEEDFLGEITLFLIILNYGVLIVNGLVFSFHFKTSRDNRIESGWKITIVIKMYIFLVFLNIMFVWKSETRTQNVFDFKFDLKWIPHSVKICLKYV